MIPKIDSFMHEYIHGDRICELADVQINSPKHCENIDKLGDENQVVFCKTDFLRDLFIYLQKFGDTERKFILITHNSDFAIGDKAWEARPRCIAKWYAENAIICRQNLAALPLGLERPLGGGYSSDASVIDKIIADDNTEYKNIVYMNHNINNNKGARERVTNLLKDKPWVTYRNHGVSFHEYCHNVRTHKFVLCPEGNGPDTHRLWEALYLGSIPILRQSAWSENWNDLPVLIVSDWEELDDGYLECQWKAIQSRKWNLEKLTMSYWKSEIEKAKKGLL